MKIVKKILVVVFILICAFQYAHIGRTNIIYDKHIDSSQYTPIEISEEAYTQRFTSAEESLDAFQIKMRLAEASKNPHIFITLQDAETKEVLMCTELGKEDIDDGRFNSVSFETLQECKGRTYEVLFNGEGVYLFVDAEGTVIMKTVTECFDMETFCVLLILLAGMALFFRFLCELFAR